MARSASSRTDRVDRAATAPIVAATVDAGSNSVHLLVAVVRSHRIEPLVDESVFLGLGAAVDERGYLGEDLRSELVATLRDYGDRARHLGATRIAFVGTEPLRRASDASRVAHAVWRDSRIPLHVVSHEEEALLTLLGVTTGRLLSGEIVVIDVGGGSSEFVVAGPSRGPIAAGLPLGSARLTTQFARHDPPSKGELEAMRREARALVTHAPDARPTEVIVVGGTASNVVRLVPGAVLDGAMTPKRVREAFAALRAVPAEEAASHFAVRVARARILPAGTVIVSAIMERYDVKRIRISDAGIREGTILALGHEGRAWRDRLARLAQGWRR